MTQKEKEDILNFSRCAETLFNTHTHTHCCTGNRVYLYLYTTLCRVLQYKLMQHGQGRSSKVQVTGLQREREMILWVWTERSLTVRKKKEVREGGGQRKKEVKRENPVRPDEQLRRLSFTKLCPDWPTACHPPCNLSADWLPLGLWPWQTA